MARGTPAAMNPTFVRTMSNERVKPIFANLNPPYLRGLDFWKRIPLRPRYKPTSAIRPRGLIHSMSSPPSEKTIAATARPNFGAIHSGSVNGNPTDCAPHSQSNAFSGCCLPQQGQTMKSTPDVEDQFI